MAVTSWQLASSGPPTERESLTSGEAGLKSPHDYVKPIWDMLFSLTQSQLLMDFTDICKIPSPSLYFLGQVKVTVLAQTWEGIAQRCGYRETGVQGASPLGTQVACNKSVKLAVVHLSLLRMS